MIWGGTKLWSSHGITVMNTWKLCITLWQDTVFLHDRHVEIKIITELQINSLAPDKFEWNFRHLIFRIISVIDGWGISSELALRWMSLDLTEDKSTLVQVMAWCRQATSHYPSQCWPRSLSPYGVTRPQWVKKINPRLLLENQSIYFIIHCSRVLSLQTHI